MMKPVIGITPSIEQNETTYTVHRAHCQAVSDAGGMPVMMPFVFGTLMKQFVRMIDGLYLTGGYDIDPHYFNEEPHPALGKINPLRDQFEIALVHAMLAVNKPILGICRGSQIINVALGGTMYQDLLAEKDGRLIQHKQQRALQYSSHAVNVDKSSLLYRIVKKETIQVNSNHHQANDVLGVNLHSVAVSEDGVIEAIERRGKPFVLGVQWHPERLLERGDVVSQKIYKSFVKEASKVRNQSVE